MPNKTKKSPAVNKRGKFKPWLVDLDLDPEEDERNLRPIDIIQLLKVDDSGEESRKPIHSNARSSLPKSPQQSLSTKSRSANFDAFQCNEKARHRSARGTSPESELPKSTQKKDLADANAPAKERPRHLQESVTTTAQANAIDSKTHVHMNPELDSLRLLLHSEQQEKENLLSEINGLQIELLDLKTTVDNLNDDKARLLEENKTLEEENKILVDARNKFRVDFEERFLRVEKEWTAVMKREEEERGRVVKELETTREYLSKLQTEYESTKRTIQDQQQKIQDYSSKLEWLSKSLEQVGQERNELLREVDSYKQKYQELQNGTLLSLEIQLNELNRELTESKLQNDELQSKLREAKIANMAPDTADVAQEAEYYRNQAEELIAENDDYKSRLERSQSQIQILQATVDQLLSSTLSETSRPSSRYSKTRETLQSSPKVAANRRASMAGALRPSENTISSSPRSRQRPQSMYSDFQTYEDSNRQTKGLAHSPTILPRRITSPNLQSKAEIEVSPTSPPSKLPIRKAAWGSQASSPSSDDNNVEVNSAVRERSKSPPSTSSPSRRSAILHLESKKLYQDSTYPSRPPTRPTSVIGLRTVEGDQDFEAERIAHNSKGKARNDEFEKTKFDWMEYVRATEALENQLRDLSSRKEFLQSEYARIPIHGGSAQSRRKKEELERMLDMVDKQIGHVRMQMKSMHVL
ncbi:hypothetical protein BKA69DRAFT_1125974 [Paraphysoderma sedebokerense]|nr:hypothetical protein BKA69DRAFT_1125974 [Paraphysoderma sedebokerense]